MDTKGVVSQKDTRIDEKRTRAQGASQKEKGSGGRHTDG
jgi:hypothetical protein